MTHVFWKTKNRNQHALFCTLSNWCCEEVTFFFTYLKQPFIKNNVSQFNTSQKKLEFYEIFAYSISPVNSLKTFYIDIKTIERVKRQTMFQTVPKK